MTNENDNKAIEYAASEGLPPGLPVEFEKIIRAMLRNAFMKGTNHGLEIASQLIAKHSEVGVDGVEGNARELIGFGNLRLW